MKIKTRWKLTGRYGGLLITSSLLSLLLLINGCEQDLPEKVEPESVDTSIPSFQAKLITDESDEHMDGKYKLLKEQFESFQVYQFNTQDVSNFVHQSPNTLFKLIFSKEDQWEMKLEPSGLMADNYQSYGISAGGRVASETMKDVFYKGATSDGGKVTITLDDQTINAMIFVNDEAVFIENIANLGVEEAPNEVIVYRSSDVKGSGKYTSTAEEVEEASQGRMTEVEKSQDECRVRVVDIITTVTYGVYETFGERNIGKLNKLHLSYINHMQSLFDEFNIKFRVTKQVVMTEDLGDPRDQVDFDGKVLIILRNYENDYVVGNAYFSGLCQPYKRSFMYVTSIYSTPFTVQTYAHHMAYLFGAPRNDDGKNIMNSSTRLGESTTKWHPETKEIINAEKFRGCVSCEEPVTKGMYLFDRSRGNGIIVGQPVIDVANTQSGDFDGDGKDDLITSNNGEWYVAYSSSFHRWENVNTSTHPIQNALIGDFNGDGKSDVFVSRNDDWYISEGATGSWKKISESKTKIPTLAVGDFNGDGVDDIMRQSDGNNGLGKGWYIVYADPGASLSHHSWTKVTNSSVHMKDVQVGDFNGDGMDDVMAILSEAASDGAGRYIIFGKEQLPFGGWEKANSSLSSMSEIRIGDFNNDGKDDVFGYLDQTSQGGAGWYVSYGGTGPWEKIRDDFQVGSGIHSLVFGDFTGDATTDVIFIK